MTRRRKVVLAVSDGNVGVKILGSEDLREALEHR